MKQYVAEFLGGPNDGMVYESHSPKLLVSVPLELNLRCRENIDSPNEPTAAVPYAVEEWEFMRGVRKSYWVKVKGEV